jgi:hypothetical protein
MFEFEMLKGLTIIFLLCAYLLPFLILGAIFEHLDNKKIKKAKHTLECRKAIYKRSCNFAGQKMMFDDKYKTSNKCQNIKCVGYFSGKEVEEYIKNQQEVKK